MNTVQIIGTSLRRGVFCYKKFIVDSSANIVICWVL